MGFAVAGHREVVAKPSFDGHRTFTRFTPRRRAATEYELYTVGQQSSPEQWLHVGWPIRFDDGREPSTASSTAIRCGNWPDYRDPAGLSQWPLEDFLAQVQPVPDGEPSAIAMPRLH